MIHAGCGGRVIEDTSLKPYEYELEDGATEFHYPLICQTCLEEIVGDSDLEGGENDLYD